MNGPRNSCLFKAEHGRSFTDSAKGWSRLYLLWDNWKMTSNFSTLVNSLLPSFIKGYQVKSNTDKSCHSHLDIPDTFGYTWYIWFFYFKWNFILWHVILLWKSALWYCICDTIGWSVIMKNAFCGISPFLWDQQPSSQNVKPTYFSKFNFFANIQSLFSCPQYIFKEKFHTPTKIHHFFSTPIQISSAPTLVKLNDRSLSPSSS